MRMTDRVSIYMGEALRRLLDERPEGRGLWTRSGLLNVVAARYQEMCRRHCPTLTLPEWLAVMDALNGVWLQSSVQDAALLTTVWASVYDADRLEGLGAKWHCDAKALAERIRDYDYATTVALVDAVERWWARDIENDEGYEESIKAVVGAEHLREP
jgi:hypothetical protein